MKIYPIEYRRDTWLERLATMPFWRCFFIDNFNGKLTRSGRNDSNLRESVISKSSRSKNRQRQMVEILIQSANTKSERRCKTLMSFLEATPDLKVYNTEAKGPMHEAFKILKGYVASEYLGPKYKSGERIGGFLHQDLMNLSFADQSFDLVLSADVLEHIPAPYRAHQEIFRILKPGGRHIFTVPFNQMAFQDEVRATMDTNGKIHHLMEPQYHYNPVTDKTEALVFVIFGLEMLVNLNKIGFVTNFYSMYQPRKGILGNNALVFEAVKPQLV